MKNAKRQSSMVSIKLDNGEIEEKEVLVVYEPEPVNLKRVRGGSNESSFT